MFRMSSRFRPYSRLTIPALMACLMMATGASASYFVDQTALNGNTLFDQAKFITPLPVFGPGYNAALPRVNAALHPFLTVKMKEFDQQVLPASLGYGPARLWGYEISDSLTGKLLAPALWPGVTIETQRHIPTTITYVNQLPSFNPNNPTGPGLTQGLISVDPTIHWANPLSPVTAVRFPATMADAMMENPCMDNPSGTIAGYACNQPFIGPEPAVPHLHGGEIPSYFDGGPDAWFTPNGLNGAGYSTFNALFGGDTGTGYTGGIAGSKPFSFLLSKLPFAKPGPAKATYIYDNSQEPGTVWFHDHGLGITRTNVYSGLEAFYFIRGPLLEPRNLPSGPYEVEMAIQDRQFDTNGQLYFPDSYSNQSVLASCGSGVDDPCLNGPPTNPDLHPFWNPEFIGDVAVVNGAPWPVLKVEPRRYLLRLLDGSNARMWNMTFGDKAAGESQPPVYVVGDDDNYLDAPAPVPSVFIAPGQRSYAIVDFSQVPFGSTVTVTNDAPVPFPSGLSPVDYTDPMTGLNVPADQPQMHYVMQFQVSVPLKGKKDTSCDPTRDCRRPTKIVNLANVTSNGLHVDKKRELILKEFEATGQFGQPGGPVEVLVQNTKWDGLLSPGIGPDFPTDGMSELPQVGSIEEWDIINLTMDAHPMHTHLTQFQILNRQPFDTDGTMGSGIPGGYVGNPVGPTPFSDGLPGAWAKAFYPSGLNNPPVCDGKSYVNPDLSAFNPCPGYGPPLAYNTPNADGAIGGNPAVGPYLIGTPIPPDASEAGWRDTAVANPGEVLRLLVRWTPTSVTQKPGQSYKGKNLYTFDPTAGPGYVWHCHIVDHEDNEMMRPYRVTN